MDYPRLVFKVPGTFDCHFGTYDYRVVKDDGELEVALVDGWFLTISEASAPKQELAQKNQASLESTVSRKDLELKASELGIKFDGRTTDAKLVRLIGGGNGLD